MRRFPYVVVDVFTTQPLEGNALAVLPDASGLAEDALQRIAREFNLSETVFVLPARNADCAARFRIFTPTMEMRFAGHPTVGGAFVVLAEGIVAAGTQRFAVEEPVGSVPVRVEPGKPECIWLTTPPIEDGPLYDARLCAEVLGLDADDLSDATPQALSAGNPNVFVALRDRAAVDRAWLDLAGHRRLHGGRENKSCVFVFCATPEGAYSRMFAPEYGVVEDPATGSATGPLALYMLRNGLVGRADGTRFVSEQGTKMGRRSLLHVALHGTDGCDGIEVGGSVVRVADGTLYVP